MKGVVDIVIFHIIMLRVAHYCTNVTMLALSWPFFKNLEE